MSSLVNRMDMCRDIHGWYDYQTLNKLLAEVHDIQTIQNESGYVGEIGVHMGKFFFALVTLIMDRENERATAIDLFDNQDENIDNSGQGDLKIFKKNIENHLEKVDIKQVNSMCLRPSDFHSKKYRIFSVDGGHTCQCTVSDLELVSEIMTEMGIIIVDDFWHTEWHGVWQGTMLFLSRSTDWVPFYVSQLHGGSNKLILCRKKHQQFYFDKFKNKYYNQYSKIGMDLTRPLQNKKLEILSWRN